MKRILTQVFYAGALTLALLPTLGAAAPSLSAVVTKVSDTMVTVKTEDGKEYQVKMADVDEGDKVACTKGKDGQLKCEVPKKEGSD